MDPYSEIFKECQSYQYDYWSEDQKFVEELESNFTSYFTKYCFGLTPWKTFEFLIKKTEVPKRFIVWGSSVGYLCFFFNKLFPDIETIGIDLHGVRIDFAKSLQKKWGLYKNIKFIQGDATNFKVKNGDLIWQNNLLFDDFDTINSKIFTEYDIQIISYKQLFEDSKIGDSAIYSLDKLTRYFEDYYSLETSWSDTQSFYIYKKEPLVENILNIENLDIRVDESNLRSYQTMNSYRKEIQSEKLRYLYNKNNIKSEFLRCGFKVPKKLHYFKKNGPLQNILTRYDKIVAKAAHLSEGDYVFIKDKNSNLEYLEKELNNCLEVEARSTEPLELKRCERGILIEEWIDVKLELKVFVVWGKPLIADLRSDNKEWNNIDFIKVDNHYLDWSKESELISNFSKEINLDFYRIDFLYDGLNLYASECAFMPTTLLPEWVENLILENWRPPYLKYYYPNMYKLGI